MSSKSITLNTLTAPTHKTGFLTLYGSGDWVPSMISSCGKGGFPPLGTGLNSRVRIICGAAAITFGNGL